MSKLIKKQNDYWDKNKQKWYRPSFRKNQPKHRYILIIKNCLNCKNDFLVPRYYIKQDLGYFCSSSCRNSEEFNPNYKIGKTKDARGYVKVLRKDHPFSDINGYVKEHRLTMEEHIGRYLDPEEVVHHKNGIRNDNRIKNLELIKSQQEHLKQHKRDQKGKILKHFKEKFNV